MAIRRKKESNLQISKKQIADFLDKINKNTENIGPVATPDNMKKAAAQIKVAQVSNIDALLKQATLTNDILKILLQRSIQYDLYPLSSNFSTLSIAAAAASQLAYRAHTDKRVILTMSGAGTLFIGNTVVNTTTGYPIVSGDALELYIQRNAEIHVVGTPPATLHILLF